MLTVCGPSTVSFHTKNFGSSTPCCPSAWCSVVKCFISTSYHVLHVFMVTPINIVCCTCLVGLSLAHLKSWRREAACGLLVANLLPALYTGLVHQRGSLDVMSRLQGLCELHSNATSRTPEVLFLMPCHSTPFYRCSLCSP